MLKQITIDLNEVFMQDHIECLLSEHVVNYIEIV